MRAGSISDYDPSGSNSYTGWDRFGRIVDQLWANDAGTVLDEYKYGYDADGNVLWKQNATPGASGLDELYTYNAMNELTSETRGTLNAAHDQIMAGTQDFSETWTLDSLGNIVGENDNGSRRPAARIRPTKSPRPAALGRRPTTRPAT